MGDGTQGAATAGGGGGHLAGVWFRVTHLDVVSGSGAVVTTAEGTEYLDFTCGIAVTNTGHCHPKVVAAIQEQAGRFLHAQVNVYRHPLLAPLADRLAAVTPPGIDTFFFANSGAEATEAAVKLARYATGRPNIVVFQGSFHGRTAQTMAMTTSKTGYRAHYQPLPAGVFVAPFPVTLGAERSEDWVVEHCLDQFDLLLAGQTAPAETAAVIIEPVLGEGGYRPAPAAFLQGLAERCRAHGILFVADEVQTGFGRTGRMFAVEHAGVVPDILVMAKGIASGFPFSAIGAPAGLMARWSTGAHGGTYGGNAVGCAAALATLEVLTEPGFLDEAAARGEQLLAGLRAVAAGHPAVADVRGLGLMVATEFWDPATQAPDAARMAAVQAHCLEHGRLILMSAGTHNNVLRWMPPLVVTAEQVDRAVSVFGEALAATEALH